MKGTHEPLRGEILGDMHAHSNTTSVYVDTSRNVIVDLTFHAEGMRKKGWFTVSMEPLPGQQRGMPSMKTKALRFTFEELETLIEEARALGRKEVLFKTHYPTQKNQEQEGSMPIREILHRINNAKHLALLWKKHYERK